MARTAIPVVVVEPYQAGTLLTQTTGDATNDHEIDASISPRLHLFVRNTGANSIDFQIVHNTGVSGYNYSSLTTDYTITSGQYLMIVLDVPGDLKQSGNLIHIDSADANFGDLRFSAFTWQDTPRNSSWQRPV